MKAYVLVVAVLMAVSGCGGTSDKLSLPEICAKRSEDEARREKFESMFLSCVNAPRRIATATDDESDIVAECRVATSHAYGSSVNTDIFMNDTAKYATDCEALKQTIRIPKK